MCGEGCPQQRSNLSVVGVARKCWAIMCRTRLDFESRRSPAFCPVMAAVTLTNWTSVLQGHCHYTAPAM
jgi:hypothetical protein